MKNNTRCCWVYRSDGRIVGCTHCFNHLFFIEVVVVFVFVFVAAAALWPMTILVA